MPAMAGLSVVTDISVAVAMCYLLNRNRSEGGAVCFFLSAAYDLF
jgi:hypothetical protein